MNPPLLEGQICGGIAQGVGQVLMEDIRFEPGSGQLLTGSFMDYAMPRARDLSAVHCDSNLVDKCLGGLLKASTPYISSVHASTILLCLLARLSRT
jgi:Molybdopterin-binding domain of aldehyde dehydrogenase